MEFFFYYQSSCKMFILTGDVAFLPFSRPFPVPMGAHWMHQVPFIFFHPCPSESLSPPLHKLFFKKMLFFFAKQCLESSDVEEYILYRLHVVSLSQLYKYLYWNKYVQCGLLITPWTNIVCGWKFVNLEITALRTRDHNVWAFFMHPDDVE